MLAYSLLPLAADTRESDSAQERAVNDGPDREPRFNEAKDL